MIWVTGCNGMLGREVCRLLKQKNIDFLGTGNEVDITEYHCLRNFVSSNPSIDFIVNCAAYTAVDKAESEPDKAFAVNSEGAGNLARIAKETDCVLIHISTDYVFDGNSVPYTEEMSVNPCCVYGSSKAEGEKKIISQLEKFYILRTSWLYGSGGNNFVYTMIKAMNNNSSLKVVNDQTGTPTSVCSLSRIILELITDNAVPYGIYHCSDCGKVTWWEFAVEIQKQACAAGLLNDCGKDCVINQCSTNEYPAMAKRPAFSVLNNSKIQKALNIQLPDWKDSLNCFINSLSGDI